MKLTVLRGISGSGKTTWATQHANEAVIVSTDQYFWTNGEYHYDPTKLQEYHNCCFRVFMEAILRKEPWIIVDNTNIRAWEYAPYILAGEAYEYTVELITFTCTIEQSQARKFLVPVEDLERIHKHLCEETRHMPRRFASIHRIIESC